MLSGVQPLGKMEVQAKDKIEVEATKDVEIKLVEHQGGALIEITATKDISNVDIKITLEGQKVATYHVDKLKAGESITKELTKAQLDKVKESLAKKIKTLPNTAVVRKNVEQTFRLDKSNLKVVVSYDVEEGTIAPNKPDVKPEGPSKPDVKPEGPSNPGKPDTKPEDSANPGTPEVKPENKVVKFEDANLKRILLKKLKAYNGQDEEDDGLAGEYNIKIKDKNYRKDKNDTEI